MIGLILSDGVGTDKRTRAQQGAVVLPVGPTAEGRLAAGTAGLGIRGVVLVLHTWRRSLRGNMDRRGCPGCPGVLVKSSSCQDA